MHTSRQPARVRSSIPAERSALRPGLLGRELRDSEHLSNVVLGGEIHGGFTTLHSLGGRDAPAREDDRGMQGSGGVGWQQQPAPRRGGGRDSAEFFGLFRGDLAGIVRTRLDASGDGPWRIDDIRYGVEPEPSAVVLVACGLSSLVLRLERRYPCAPEPSQSA
jgi:hypothetical protein